MGAERMWMILAIGCVNAGALHLSGEVDASGPMVVEVRRLAEDSDVLAFAATEASGRFDLVVPPGATDAPTDQFFMVAVVAWSDTDGDGARGPSDTPVGVATDPKLFHVASAGQTSHGVPIEAQAGWNVAEPPTPGRIVGKRVKGVVDVVIPANVALREPAVRSLRVRLQGRAWPCVGVQAPTSGGGRAGSGLVTGVAVGSDGRAVIELPEEPPWPGHVLSTVEMTYGRVVAWEADSCDRYDAIEDDSQNWMAPLVVYARATEPDGSWLSVYPNGASPNRWALVGEGAQPMADELVLDAR